ncbi:MAG: Hsp70 family protein [Acidimicrobiales bacterium]|nr:Hsp70 family protein [Acidimicrobiales bacterium]MCB1014985.1 Hsp70 family protein [Acidimicrobiales bacterium]MCB9373509.1 Hsp70 family protein [Microthrixaceae bacterium]
MSYQLGVDLGTTFTAAAVARGGRVEIASLDYRTAAIPSVVWVGADGTVVIGHPALNRGLSDPSRMAREFKRRMGDPTPLLLGGTPFSADALTERLLKVVSEAVASVEGGRPDSVTITHPANWGPYKKDLLSQAVRRVDLPGTALLSEPEAAAIYYASTEKMAAGEVLAVYDLGGGTFDAAVLRKTDESFEMLGEPEGIERLGGIDFDEAVLNFVNEATDGALDDLDPDDPEAVEAIVALREDCTIAKEVLSSDTEASIKVWLPSKVTRVRMTRAEFEAIIRPTLVDTVNTMRRAMDSASVKPAEVDKVLLVGGSSRIPLVGQLIGAEIGRPVVVDAHPKHAIALGAALHAASTVGKRAAMSSQQPAEPSAVQLAEPPTGEQMANLPPTSIITPLERQAVEPDVSLADRDSAVSGPTVQVSPAMLAQAAGAVLVPGIYCPQQHFNDPRLAYCASCGQPLSRNGADVRQGPRPPLGVLVLDDGQSYVLDRDYVLGRDPDNDESVRTGDALALVVADPTRSISRVHARIELDEWDVRLSDCTSANGTFTAYGGSNWTPVVPGHATTIQPGTHVLLGQRTLLFDSPRRLG